MNGFLRKLTSKKGENQNKKKIEPKIQTHYQEKF